MCVNPRWHIWQLKQYQLCSNTGLSVTISAEHPTSASLHNLQSQKLMVVVMLRSVHYLEIFVLIAIFSTELPHTCRMMSNSASETVIWKKWSAYAACVYMCWNKTENFREKNSNCSYKHKDWHLESSWGSPATSRMSQLPILIKYHYNINY